MYLFLISHHQGLRKQLKKDTSYSVVEHKSVQSYLQILVYIPYSNHIYIYTFIMIRKLQI